jgi:hypothetical protein
METQLQTVFSGDADRLFSIIRELNNDGTFTKVYVSIGGKFNDPLVSFNQAKLIDRRTNQPIIAKAATNALQQMVPDFLLFNSSDRILVLVVDDFKYGSSNYEINQKIIKRGLSESESTIHVILFDQICAPRSLTVFLEKLTNFASENLISEKNFIVCNYVKFLNNPNSTERDSENVIPETIQTALNKFESGKYSYCFYEWFGYNFYLYNFIYNYRRISHLPNMSILRDQLTEFVKNVYMDGNFLEKNRNQKIRFLDNIYDITLPVSTEDGFTKSLKDYLTENGEL